MAKKGNIMAQSYSSLAAYQACPTKYMWAYVYNLQKRETSKNLLLGKAFHEGVAYAFITGNSLEKVIEHTKNWAEDDEIAVHVEGLLRYHLPKILARFEPVLCDEDQKPYIETRFQHPIGDVPFVGVVDAILREKSSGDIFLIDWKTRSSSFWPPEALFLDKQLALYAYQVMKGGIDIDYIGWYQVSTKVPRPAKINKNGLPSVAASLSDWDTWWNSIPEPTRALLNEKEWKLKMEGKLKDSFYAFDYIVAPTDFSSLEEFVKNSVNTLLSDETFYGTMSYNTCKMCDFRELCVARAQGGNEEKIAFTNENFIKWG